MTLWAALTKYFQVVPLRITFLVVNSMVPRILVADLMRLVAETVVNIVELVLHRLIFWFVVDIEVFPYADIIM